MYSANNEGTSVVAERFIRTLKPKISKYMTSISKNVYIDKSDDMVNKYNNTYSTIKMKLVDVTFSTYIDFGIENNDKGPKFKVGNHGRLLKYKNILQKVILQIGLKKVLWLKNLKILCHGHMLLVNITVKKLLECFTKKNCKRQIKRSLELKKQSKEKRINYTVNGKAVIVCLIGG